MMQNITIAASTSDPSQRS